MLQPRTRYDALFNDTTLSAIFNTQTSSQKSHLFPSDVRRGLSRRELPHVPVEITTVLVAHSLQLSLRRFLVEEMQLLGTVTELKTSVAGHCLHINQL